MAANPATSPRRLTTTRAWTYLGINLFATPGLGSFMGGRKLAGMGQLCFSVSGFLLIVAWMFKTSFSAVSAEMDGTDAVPVPAMWWKGGVLLFGIAWLWSLVTSISLVRQSWTTAAATPPLLPPRLADLPAPISGVLLTNDRLATSFLTVMAWRRQDNAITRTFQLPDFPAAMAFVNQVATLAEQAQHHPDIDIRWNRVTLVLSTHDAGGLTEKDFALARQIDQIQS